MFALLAIGYTFIIITTAQEYGLPLAERVITHKSGHYLPIAVPSYAPPVPIVPVHHLDVPTNIFKAPVKEESPVFLPENTKIDIRDKSGQYSHGFNAGGTQVSEQGSLITTNGGWEYVIAKKGSYSYTSPEGEKIAVHYIADHNGFRTVDGPESL